MLAYKEHFKKHHIIIGQALATHADIEDYENHADSLLGVTKSHFEMRTLLILNENDTLSTEELIALDRGIDNDKNALLHAKLNKAKTLYIITNTNGVYKKKDDPNSWIPEIQYRELTNGYIERLT
jgi:glutamate 5-kinase